MPIEIRVPQLTQTMTEAEIVRWLKVEGEQVKAGEPLLEMVTDKATVDVESPSPGMLGKILVPQGIAPVGKVICVLLAPGEELPVPAQTEEPAAATETVPAAAPKVAAATESTGRARISPIAKRLAVEKGVELSRLVPSGPGGLVIERDVKAYLETAAAAGRAHIPPAGFRLIEGQGDGRPHGDTTSHPTLPGGITFPPSSDEEVIPLTGVRRIIADRLALSRHTAADVTTVAEVDMGEVAGLREHLRFTYTAFVAQAVAIALGEYPILNSRLERDRIVVNRRIHLGVAVAIDEGLKVPVLRDAHSKGLRQVAEDLANLARRGTEGSLCPEELSGSTFTLTNSGVFGSLFFTPIINPPESAILGMGKIMKTPVVRDDQIVIRPMMYLCLTYDHRVVDGAPAVKFLQRVKALLEKPALML